MGLFSFFKKKEGKVEEKSCTCGCESKAETSSEKSCSCGCESKAGNFTVKILGGGCANCNKLEENAKVALEQMNVNFTIEHVKDMGKIASYGVMRTPALVVNEKVLSQGKILKVEEVEELLKEKI